MARGATENRVTVIPFDAKDIVDRIHAAAGGDDDRKVADQVRYLGRYCKSLGIKTVVVEDHYIDRHYLDEFAFYYCRSLSPPPNYVRRFHVFSHPFDARALRAQMEAVAAGSDNQSDIERSYRGFVSVRPIAAVPVGRTVLTRLDDGEPRDIWATGNQHAHLANLQLEVNGLAFQQQDLAVGACATAALWSALSRVSRLEGMRAPTPAEVSEGAGRHLLTGGRVVPAVAGLTMEQLCEAIRSCGFAPEYVRAQRLETLGVAIHTYLLSGIPVVLALRRGRDSGHAVAAVGFKAGATAHPLLQSTVNLRSARVEKLYIHDDRIGPYARAFPVPCAPTQGRDESLALRIETNRDRAGAPVERWVVAAALAPVYPKVRLSVRNLMSLAEAMAGTVEGYAGDKAHRLSVEFFYRHAGRYLRTLPRTVDPKRAASSMTKMALPRWCAVVRWFLDDTEILDFVYDSTDVLREPVEIGDLLRGIACLHPGFSASAEQLADRLAVPFV